MRLIEFLGILSISLFLTIPSTHAWFNKHIVKKDVNETDAVEEEFNGNDPVFLCNSYWRLSHVLTSCQNLSYPDNPEAAFILDSLQDMCGNEDALRACFAEEISHCDNQAHLTALLDTTFGFCVNNDVPADLKQFLTTNYNVELDRNCMSSVLNFENATNKECNYTTMPPCGGTETLQGSIDLFQQRIGWYVNCFKTFNLDETPDNCDVTRRTAYSILTSSLQVFNGYGMNNLGFFEEFNE